jgi:hypothetical protein
MRNCLVKIFVLLIFFGNFSCNSVKIRDNKSESTESFEKKIQKATEYISSDTVFVERLQRYYPDLGECKNLNFEANNVIKPIGISFFRKNQLVKTSFFEKYDVKNDVDFKQVKEDYDKSTFFEAYQIMLNKNTNTKCKIDLTFSNENNNLLPVKFQVFDENIDPRIDYKPRTGYYLIEYDGKGEILKRFYVIKSN